METVEELAKGITAKRGPGGAGDVTEEKKKRIINKAVMTWKRQGLSEKQIAFGIATMNIESGLNPGAKGTSKTEKGAGAV